MSLSLGGPCAFCVHDALPHMGLHVAACSLLMELHRPSVELSTRSPVGLTAAVEEATQMDIRNEGFMMRQVGVVQLAGYGVSC